MTSPSSSSIRRANSPACERARVMTIRLPKRGVRDFRLPALDRLSKAPLIALWLYSLFDSRLVALASLPTRKRGREFYLRLVATNAPPGLDPIEPRLHAARRFHHDKPRCPRGAPQHRSGEGRRRLCSPGLQRAHDTPLPGY